jgi:hypothetical protein
MNLGKNKLFFKLIKIVIILITSYVLFVMFFPHNPRLRHAGLFNACSSNCKNISTALDMYYEDNNKHYPISLSQLTPTYIRNLPVCGEAKRETYSSTYVCNKTRDAYTFYCGGENHASILNGNYPQYNSRAGLVSK